MNERKKETKRESIIMMFCKKWIILWGIRIFFLNIERWIIDR